MINYTDLSDEIANDPAALGYAPHVASGNDLAIAALCNEATVSVVGEVDRAQFAIWAVNTGMYGKIKDIAANTNHALRHSALAILAVLEGGASTGIDFAIPENITNINAWESAAELSTANKNALMAIATRTVARSVSLFGQTITAADVAKALRG